MTCSLVVMPDGSRAIVCSRPWTAESTTHDPGFTVKLASPWKVGARVKHHRYGHGLITKRNAEAIDICFDDPAIVSDRRFVLALVGKGLEVVP
jgi:hypothetical protein